MTPVATATPDGDARPGLEALSSPGRVDTPTTLTPTRDRDKVVLICVGELDVASAAALRHALAGLMTDHPAHVTVDLRAVTFFDCSAMGAFVDARNQLRSKGSDLSLEGLTPFGQKVLKITGLTDLESELFAPASTVPTFEGSGPPEPPSQVAIRLSAASRSSIEIEQTKGLMAERYGLRPDQALAVLSATADADVATGSPER